VLCQWAGMWQPRGPRVVAANAVQQRTGRSAVWLFCGVESLQAHMVEAQKTDKQQSSSLAVLWGPGLAVMWGRDLVGLRGRGLVGLQGRGPADGDGVGACLFFLCIVVWRSLPWAGCSGS
jgi:hypothetical protein